MYKKIIDYFLFIKRRLVIKKNFIECNNFLKSGIYKFSTCMKYIYINENDIGKKSYQLFHRNFTNKYIRFLRSIVYFILFSKPINVLNKTDKFQGQVYLPGNEGNKSLSKRAKIFDFINMKIVEIFDSEDEIERKITYYHYYFQYYNVPKIYEVNKEKMYLIEEFILDNKKASDTKKILAAVLDKQINQIDIKCLSLNNNIIEKLVYVNKKISDLYCFDIIENMDYEIHEYNQLFVECIQHGDLWFGNIFMMNYGPIIIDYEHSGNYWFCYDFFTFLLHEYSKYSRFDCLDAYVMKEYDFYLDKIFCKLNTHYKPEGKADYFSIYVLYRNSVSMMSKNDLIKCFEVINYIKGKSV